MTTRLSTAGAASARLLLGITFTLGLAALAGACGDDSGAGEVTAGQIASLELSHRGAPVAFNTPFILSPRGEADGADEVLRILNTGNGDLVISELSVSSAPDGVLRLTADDGEALPPEELVVPPAGSYAFHLIYEPAGEPLPSGLLGTITFRSNAVRNGVSTPTLTLEVALDDQRPRLQTSPAAVDFGVVGEGQAVTRTVSVLNAGSAALVVDRVALGGHPGFTAGIGPESLSASAETAAGVDLATPLEVAPGETALLSVSYAPSGPEPASAELTLFSNDPAAPEGTRVPLSANSGGPCIAVAPRKVAFGGRQVGRQAAETVTITSCGDEPLVISQIAVAAGGSESVGVSTAGTVMNLAMGATTTFGVTYAPSEVALLDADGNPVRETAQVSILSNAFLADTRLDVSGFGTNPACPTPVITSAEGLEVVPQTTLHLSAGASTSGAGDVTRWRWEVEQPVGSQSRFEPSAEVRDPTFEVNVAGTYVFRLRVTDASGAASCAAASMTVAVTSSQAIHIELLWRTPSDADEATAPGTDLDLHFAHPAADSGHDGDGDGVNDPWFDLEYDTFWFRKHPDWGVPGSAADDPSLDRDDKDGAGPENVNLNAPESGLAYAIGVHYWAAHGFQTAFATVRVYIFGQKVFEVPDVELSYDDFWTVGTLAWPERTVSLARVCSGTFTPCAGDASCSGGARCVLRIAHAYDNVAIPN